MKDQSNKVGKVKIANELIDHIFNSNSTNQVFQNKPFA